MKTDEEWYQEYDEYVDKHVRSYNQDDEASSRAGMSDVMIDILFELKKIAYELKRGNAK